MRIHCFSFVLLYFLFVNNVNCLLKKVLHHFYCNNENCYDILGVNEKASLDEIKFSYFRLLKKVEKNHDREKKKRIVKAFNVLVNKSTRKYYDYYLKYPNSFLNLVYLNMYIFYKLFKIICILLLIGLLLCVFQYIHNKYELKRVIQKSSKNKAFKKEVQNRISSQHPGFMNYDIKKKKKIEEQIEEEVVQEIVMINNQKTKKLLLADLIIVKLLFLPKQLWFYIIWNIKWVIKYNILNEDYDEHDKIYITRKYMNISMDKWNTLNPEEKKNYLKRELWMKAKQEEFLQEIKERDRLNKISSAKYKKQIRMKKKGLSFNYND
ncbi:hypothetical protein PFMALIP_03500 [Plasmodium falciparum MaliPS096_E11]|uniref:J domain-containing protein n=1 Tax=Plasmodium falciparum MaliPS096_E11 TaxID=1036727 RepID=A0A024WPT4_PLAFA|nr:hypothetical protein PFMALIP_03500 [Plasmodium falciparum MaliPS096_E11]